MAGEVVWAGPYPAHYSRSFHRALEERRPDTFHFLYVVRPGREAGRSYERGRLPEARTVVDGAAVLATLDETLRVLRDVDPAAVVVNGHSPPALAGAAIWGLARGRKVAYRSDTNIVDLFRRRSAARRGFHRLLGRSLLRSVDVLLHVGTLNRWYYRWATGCAAVELTELRVPHPLTLAADTGASTARDDSDRGSEDVLTFLYLGRLAPEKSVGNLILAAHRLAGNFRSWRLLVAGDGQEADSLRRSCEDLGLEGHVEFVGAVESDARAAVFGRADAFVLPSVREPWGLVVSEALYSGLPVIAPCWVGSVQDLVVDGYNGIVLDSNSPRALARGMELFLEDPGRAAEMGARGPEVVSAGGWTLEGALEQMDDVLEALS